MFESRYRDLMRMSDANAEVFDQVHSELYLTNTAILQKMTLHEPAAPSERVPARQQPKQEAVAPEILGALAQAAGF